MAAPLYLTKGELRAKLLTRLGYGGLGSAAGMFVPMADDLLEEAQEQLFQIFTDEKGIREWEFSAGVNQRWYDIPDTCDIDRILGMYAQQNGDYWHPLTRGIGPEHDSDYDDIKDYPYRYDIRVRGIDTPLPNQQLNGDMATEDISASGTEPGWTWGAIANAWEITAGAARCLTNSLCYFTSTFVLTPSVLYTLEYYITGEGVTAVSFGGTGFDVDGRTLGHGAGQHKYTVLAAGTSPLKFIANSASGVKIDNVLIVEGENTQVGNRTPQIEIWPKSDMAYLMKIEGPMIISDFVADGDRASFDSRLILLYAIAFGKAHLNKPDAKSAMDAWTTRLVRIKANQHGTREYVRRNPSKPEIEIRSRPKVI